MENKKRKARSDRRHIVYQITCTRTNQSYIGITVGFRQKDLKVRIQKHVWRAFNEAKNWPLCNSILNYGPESHEYEIIAIVRGKAEAHMLERELIAEFQPKLNRTGVK